MKLRHIKFFGARYALNLIIDWVNEHQVQSEETLEFREDVSSDIAMLEERMTFLEGEHQSLADECKDLHYRLQSLEPTDNPNKFSG